MQINKAYQDFLGEGQNRGNVSYLTFTPKSGWRLSKDEAGADSQLHKGKLLLDPESLSAGFKMFTCNEDGESTGAASRYASGTEPVIKLADLPEMTHKDFDGNIRTNKDGWKRAARIRGVLARKIGDVKEFFPVVYDADRIPALQDLARLLAACQEKVDAGEGAYPAVALGAREYSFTTKAGAQVHTRAPELKVAEWKSKAAYASAVKVSEAPVEAKPTPVEDNPPSAPIDEVLAMADAMDEEEHLL